MGNLHSLLATTAIVTAVIGGLLDLIAAGTELGFLVPAVLFMIAFVAVLIPRTKLQIIPHWKWGAILSLLTIAILTSVIAYYSEKTQRGILAQSIPALAVLQERLGLIDVKLDSIISNTKVIKEDVALQNLSFSGNLLELNPVNSYDFLKNSYILYKNNKMPEALKSLETHIYLEKALKIDVGALLVRILIKNDVNQEKYLRDKYESTKFPGYIFSAFAYTSLSKESMDEIFKFSKRHPKYIPLQYGVTKVFSQNLFEGTLDELFYHDEVWSNLKKQRTISSLQNYFWGDPVSLPEANYNSLASYIFGFNPILMSNYNLDRKKYLNRFIDSNIYTGEAKICLYRQAWTKDVTKKGSYFEVVDPEGKKIKGDALTKNNSEKNCHVNIMGLAENRYQMSSTYLKRLKVYFIDYDKVRYGPWKFQDGTSLSYLGN